jgi:hypothetical protein
VVGRPLLPEKIIIFTNRDTMIFCRRLKASVLPRPRFTEAWTIENGTAIRFFRKSVAQREPGLVATDAGEGITAVLLADGQL